MELEARARRREPAVFSEVVALRALDFLRKIEQRCREGGTAEQLAVCLNIQVALLARLYGLLWRDIGILRSASLDRFARCSAHG